MPTPFPNELLTLIFCDVLSTYVHSFVLLPKTFGRWHAHYTLRSVSRHFKALTDHIWHSAVGIQERWVELPKLHTAMCTGKFIRPENPVSFLIRAYGAYVVGMILRSEPDADMALARRAYGIPQTHPLRSLYTWLRVADAVARKVRPREFGYVLAAWVNATIHTDQLESALIIMESIVTPALYPAWAAAGVITAQQALSKLDGIIDELNVRPQLMHRMEYRIVAKHEEIGRMYPPLIGHAFGDDEEQINDSRSRKILSSIVSLLKEQWFVAYEVRQARKAILHGTAKYGI